MDKRSTRRQFLHTAAIGGAVGLGELGFLGRLPAVSAADAKLDPKVVRLDSGIEPLVRLLEETPRDRLLEEVAARIRKGTTYQEVLASLLLAGVRNVEPRPSVGFKFHAVLVVNSAHLASLAGPDSERWLPIFWALDYFKSAQAQNIKERDGWRMKPVDETKVPPARKAREAFVKAMEEWDEGLADAATAALVRSAGADEVMELFWKYSPRDFRAIGHKIIFASNARRTLGVIGWHHAEPVLRSLAYANLSYTGGNPAKRDDPVDRPGKRNKELARQIRAEWEDGKPDPAATADLLAALRTASDEDVCKRVVEMLNKGVSASSVWDGLLAGSAELVMRKPNIASLHAMTTTNAIRFAFETSGDDQTRRWLLLQNAAFLPLFRGETMNRKDGKATDARVDALEPEAPQATGAEAVKEIFADVSRDKMAAARKVVAYLAEDRDARAKELLSAARLLVFLKGNDAHDYKYSSAVLEDYGNATPAYRDKFLAASLFLLHGAGDKDSGLLRRTREALKG